MVDAYAKSRTSIQWRAHARVAKSNILVNICGGECGGEIFIIILSICYYCDFFSLMAEEVGLSRKFFIRYKTMT
jgi:hypothetical protein